MAKEKINPFASMSNKRKEEQDKILNKALNKPEEIKPEPVKEEKKEIEKEKKVEEVKPVKKETAPAKKKEKGTGNVVRTTISIPKDVVELMNIAVAYKYKGNASAYITDLIEKDIKANGKLYKQINELTK